MTSLKTITNFNLLSTVSKGRKPKFELHLKIYDLNNVPLVSGCSHIKWHLSHSIHADHRGRTPKCSIVNHKVEYNYSAIVGHIRISVDKNNNLTECPIEFEVLQEFPTGGVGGGGRDEKISLGVVKLNLSEYIDESEARPREVAPRLSRESNSSSRGHFRKQSAAGASTVAAMATNNTTSASPSASVSSRPASSSGTPVTFDGLDADVEDGIVRRYLMQESKINSTLKIGILMVHVDGDRNFVAPPLKTAPVFGGIAGIMAGEQVEQVDPGQLPTLAKSRDQAEIQDMYRKSLAASWSRHPGELSADECIENIFAGGDGWPTPSPSSFDPPSFDPPPSQLPQRQPSQTSDRSTGSSGPNEQRAFRRKRALGFDASADVSGDDDSIFGSMGGDTLRPGDYRKFVGRQLAQASAYLHGHGHGHGHGTPTSATIGAVSPSRHHRRHGSNTSDKSASTVTGRDPDFFAYSLANQYHHPYGPSSSTAGTPYSFRSPSPSPSPSGKGSRSSSLTRRRRGDALADSRDDLLSPARSRSESMTSLAPTLGSGSSDGPAAVGAHDGAYRRMRELRELDVRDDMIAWSLPGEVK
ncbi:hypothetical protein SODALDRAFT_285906 [Sodiomyces alkalinus F11]|uniref:C2 NT-type domain-containing protein n=1 Tax=Sodiomyces alkalinus (strain CBS 110278 / VKM F-3762 / F11) TaxID=1314773 RepID=A0A3N2PK40_SODAK|nr:hypothetical protein SODALDRAFT_285906 [Sodiomyces alkalinus F11]ROT34754.1 hypothetical protein SODALDRAFT_285906 [Sodiomyces alkalinus F11]